MNAALAKIRYEFLKAIPWRQESRLGKIRHSGRDIQIDIAMF
jgi:hypothetical protein